MKSNMFKFIFQEEQLLRLPHFKLHQLELEPYINLMELWVQIKSIKMVFKHKFVRKFIIYVLCLSMKKNLWRLIQWKCISLNNTFYLFQELRLEDYIDNRKFPSTTTSLFPSGTSTTSLFGGTSTTTNRKFQRR